MAAARWDSRYRSIDLEQRRLLGAGAGTRRIETEVAVCLGRSDATARSALEETVLDQKRFIDFLECAGIFTNSGGNSANPDRSTVEFLDDGFEDASVHVIETELIDLEQHQRVRGNFARDSAARADLGEISYTP